MSFNISFENTSVFLISLKQQVPRVPQLSLSRNRLPYSLQLQLPFQFYYPWLLDTTITLSGVMLHCCKVLDSGTFPGLASTSTQQMLPGPRSFLARAVCLWLSNLSCSWFLFYIIRGLGNQYSIAIQQSKQEMWDTPGEAQARACIWLWQKWVVMSSYKFSEIYWWSQKRWSHLRLNTFFLGWLLIVECW